MSFLTDQKRASNQMTSCTQPREVWYPNRRTGRPCVNKQFCLHPPAVPVEGAKTGILPFWPVLQKNERKSLKVSFVCMVPSKSWNLRRKYHTESCMEDTVKTHTIILTFLKLHCTVFSRMIQALCYVSILCMLSLSVQS